MKERLKKALADFDIDGALRLVPFLSDQREKTVVLHAMASKLLAYNRFSRREGPIKEKVEAWIRYAVELLLQCGAESEVAKLLPLLGDRTWLNETLLKRLERRPAGAEDVV